MPNSFGDKASFSRAALILLPIERAVCVSASLAAFAFLGISLLSGPSGLVNRHVAPGHDVVAARHLRGCTAALQRAYGGGLDRQGRCTKQRQQLLLVG